MKKIAILNDIHGNYYLLEKVLNEINKNKIDDYIIGGDVIASGPDDNKVLEFIKNNIQFKKGENYENN